LSEPIRSYHQASRGTYGSPRLHADLADEGLRVGRKRVARWMRAAGLQGVSRRQGPRTTVRDTPNRPALDLLNRHFTAAAPNRLWVADLTYVPTLVGCLDLAVVLDVFSRRRVGWSMAPHRRTELVLDALHMACRQRRPTEVMHHSDQGSPYTSVAFGNRCHQRQIRVSMGSVGEGYDKARCERFFATLACEWLDRHRFQHHGEARMAIFSFIAGWYNPRRRHSSLDYLSAMAYEERDNNLVKLKCSTLH
jgi:putative transposase